MSSTNEPWFVTERSEALAGLLLTSRKDVRVRDERKHESGLDFLVEIDTDDPLSTQLFVVQVTQDDIDRMVAYPAPTYVVGIDVNAIGVGFLLSANEPREHVASLTTRFRIDCGVLEQLRDEVIDFWSSRNMTLTGSRFRE